MLVAVKRKRRRSFGKIARGEDPPPPDARTRQTVLDDMGLVTLVSPVNRMLV